MDTYLLSIIYEAVLGKHVNVNENFFQLRPCGHDSTNFSMN